MSFLYMLEKIIQKKRDSQNPSSYTVSLLTKNIDNVLQKVGEEAVEYIIDAKNHNKQRSIEEVSDLIYHLLVSFQFQDITLDDINNELQKRHK